MVYYAEYNVSHIRGTFWLHVVNFVYEYYNHE